MPVIGGGKIETKVNDDGTAPYSAAEMSDGERVIFYLIGRLSLLPLMGSS